MIVLIVWQIAGSEALCEGDGALFQCASMWWSGRSTD